MKQQQQQKTVQSSRSTFYAYPLKTNPEQCTSLCNYAFLKACRHYVDGKSLQNMVNNPNLICYTNGLMREQASGNKIRTL